MQWDTSKYNVKHRCLSFDNDDYFKECCTVQYKNIPEHEQEFFITSFWQMLQECEQKVIENNDPVFAKFVEQWYIQWNRVTRSNLRPSFKIAKK